MVDIVDIADSFYRSFHTPSPRIDRIKPYYNVATRHTILLVFPIPLYSRNFKAQVQTSVSFS